MVAGRYSGWISSGVAPLRAAKGSGELLLDAISRAARVGHDNARGLALLYLAAARIDTGDLETAEGTAREAIRFGNLGSGGWTFIAETLLGAILLYRGQTDESVSVLKKATGGPLTGVLGYAEGMLAWAMTAAGTDGAVAACNAAMQCLPRPGTTRSLGAWYAVLNLTQALCHSGRREEAGCLLVEAEKIAAEWECNDFGFPVRTAAGIAAACAGNWTHAEEHHRASIARMDAVPYVAAQPIARYWYADMLLARGDIADIEAARRQLQETIEISDAIGLALYARLGRQRLGNLLSKTLISSRG